MMRRCYMESEGGYPNYGGRGVVVCERWFDWRNFLADMGGRPDGLSLDRIDVNGIYEPGNCRWADVVTQSRNMRTNVWVLVEGKSMLACDAARLLGVTPSCISRRIKSGAPITGRRVAKDSA